MRLGRMAAVAAGLGVAAAAAWAAREIPLALGGVPQGERVGRSPRYREGSFHNPPGPVHPPAPGGRGEVVRELLFGGGLRRPSKPIPVVSKPAGPAAEGLAVTWYGHASTLVEIEGRRVLFDPVWSKRCSPSQSVGPRRLHPVPVPLADLPRVDVIVISHDHYDHLDLHTIKALARDQDAPFVVPLGVGAHLAKWGVAASRVIELDWGESAQVAGLDLVATAAHHFSGRGLASNPTLWGSWVVAGSDRRVFYSGDSGYFDGYAEIGRDHGPFDLTLIQIGAYSPYWPDIHMTPEEGVATHVDVRGGLMVPVHWATFVLALHDWAEPVERLLTEAGDREIRVAVPRPGERIDVDDAPKPDLWWRKII
ncbi:MAG: outer membrane protein romA [Actinomycetia bacterium]|nr:outer membrane protein romA [Actinomycetes bacterium]